MIMSIKTVRGYAAIAMRDIENEDGTSKYSEDEILEVCDNIEHFSKFIRYENAEEIEKRL